MENPVFLGVSLTHSIGFLCVCVSVCVSVCLRSIRGGSHPSARVSTRSVAESSGGSRGFFSLFISVPFVCDSLKCCSTHPSIIHFTPFSFFSFFVLFPLLFVPLLCHCVFVRVRGIVTACAHISMCVCVCVFVSICVRFWMSVYIWMCVCVYVSSPLSWLQFLCRQMQLLDRAA